MGTFDSIKAFGTEQVVKAMVGSLRNASDETIIKLTYLAEKLTPIEYYRDQIRGLRQMFEEKRPQIVLARRVLQETHPNVRQKLIENLIVKSILLGVPKRQKLEKELGCQVPFFFVVSPSMRCNLNCYGCYAGEYRKESDMPIENLDRIFTEANEIGMNFLTFSGGEPFFRKEHVDLMEKHEEISFQVYTNGTFIDRDLARRLSKMGNVYPCISVEGYEAETDARRGKGTYKKIMGAMEALRDEGVLFGFSITATSKNTELVCSDEFMDNLINKGPSFGWYFTYVPVGKKPDVSLMPTPEQRLVLRDHVHHLRYDKPIFIGDFWNDGPYVGGCLAGGRRYFHINNAGDVEPCVFCHFTVDNIKDKSLKEVFSSPFFRAIQEDQPYDNNLMRPCMLIDVPESLRQAVEKYGARPSHEGADTIIHELKDDIDKYSAAYKKLADDFWENNYKGTIYYKDYRTERKEYIDNLQEKVEKKETQEKAEKTRV
ncbi:MAG: radical SAM protein [Candidatus Atribacteria bacterium]|nr:radical SAM protein [Candidatus Atribacteria bacterium]